MGELQAALSREHYLPGPAWDRELERVWRRSWVCVGRATELGLGTPGRVAVVEVAGESILLTTDSGGQLYGHANVCRHRGAQLCPHLPGAPPNPREASSLRCAYHGWTYAMDGRLLTAPHTGDLDDLDPGSFGLHPVSAGIWGGFAFVRLTVGDHSLSRDLDPVPSRVQRYPLAGLISAHRTVHDVAANWKIVAENFAESYHCAAVHPELIRLVPAFDQVGLDLGVLHRDGAWTFSFSGTSPRPPFADLQDGERVRHRVELLPPNLLLALAAEHVAAFVLTPLDAGHTRITFDVLIEPAQIEQDVDDCAGLWDLVNHQDRAVCESVQRGTASSFHTHGWFGPREERSLDVRRWVLSRLESPPDDGSP